MVNLNLIKFLLGEFGSLSGIEGCYPEKNCDCVFFLFHFFKGGQN